MKKSKFYAVRRGRKTGIFHSWNQCNKQVHGYSNAEHKSFKTLEEANAYLNGRNVNPAPKKKAEKCKTSKQYRLEQRQKELLEKISSGKYYVIYLDGKCRPSSTDVKVHSSDKSAWAYLIEWRDSSGQKHQDYDGSAQYGASRYLMSLVALNNAMEELTNLGFQEKHLLFVSHSTYVIDPFGKGWLAKWKQKGWKKAEGKLKHKGLWINADKYLQQLDNCEFEWAKRNTGIHGMKFVDEYLNQCIDDMLM